MTKFKNGDKVFHIDDDKQHIHTIVDYKDEGMIKMEGKQGMFYYNEPKFLEKVEQVYPVGMSDQSNKGNM